MRFRTTFKEKLIFKQRWRGRVDVYADDMLAMSVAINLNDWINPEEFQSTFDGHSWRKVPKGLCKKVCVLVDKKEGKLNMIVWVAYSVGESDLDIGVASSKYELDTYEIPHEISKLMSIAGLPKYEEE